MLGFNGILMKWLGLGAGGWLGWFALRFAKTQLRFQMDSMVGDAYQNAGAPLIGALLFYLAWTVLENRMTDGFRYWTALFTAGALSLVLHGALISSGVLTGRFGLFIPN